MASKTHPDHAAAARELGARLDNGETMIIPGHCLVECYSVLTRMPPDRRVQAREAFNFLSDFASSGDVVALSGQNYLPVLESAVAAGISGGRIYDALIAEAARLGKADVLLTFNLRHFAGLPHSPSALAPR